MDLIEDFRQKVKKAFPDLSSMTIHHEEKCISFDMWPYTDEGMNALDDAVMKVIKKNFKGQLQRMDEEEYWDLYEDKECPFNYDDDLIIKII